MLPGIVGALAAAVPFLVAGNPLDPDSTGPVAAWTIASMLVLAGGCLLLHSLMFAGTWHSRVVPWIALAAWLWIPVVLADEASAAPLWWLAQAVVFIGVGVARRAPRIWIPGLAGIVASLVLFAALLAT